MVDGISDAELGGMTQAVPTQLRPCGPALRHTSNLGVGQGGGDVRQALPHLLHAANPPLAAAAMVAPPQPAPAAAAGLGHHAPRQPLPASAASAAVGQCEARALAVLQPAGAEAAGVEKQSEPDEPVEVRALGHCHGA